MIRKSPLRSWLLAGSILALAVLLGATTAVAAQETIQEAEQRQEQIEEERQDVNNRIAYISGQQLEILQGRNEARQAFEEQQAKIQAVRQARNASSLRHLQLQEDIAAFQTQLEELNRVKTDIVVQRYLQDRTDPVEILFSNVDVGEGLSLAALTETLFSNAADVAEQARVVSDDLRLAQQESERLLTEMADLDRELTEALPLLEERRASWEALQEQYDRIASEWRTARANLDAEDRALEAFIQEERAREEIRRRLAQLALSGGDGFVRPARGNVVSVYGNRLHPILGYYRLHAGIDYDGQTGDSVIASRSGIVILVGWRGGYGRTIILQHNEGFTTLYAHLSSYNVEVDQVVEAGQKIGEIGSTGLSTGPHLHFEIRKDGVPVDPAPYL